MADLAATAPPTSLRLTGRVLAEAPPRRHAAIAAIAAPQFAPQAALRPVSIDWNPLHWPAAATAGAVAEGAAATAKVIMTGFWQAVLWVMGFVFKIEDTFLSPDLSKTGPLRTILPITVGIAAALIVVIVFGQLILALVRRDLSSVGRIFMGMFQFVAANLMTVTYAAALITGVSGLTGAILDAGLHVSSFGQWAAAENWPREVADTALAFVLGMCALWLVWPACLAHLTVMIARAVALVVLVATSPISAAGLVGESTSRWFWIAVRWFHAAAFIPPLTALVLAAGVQMSNATTQGAGQGAAAAGSALIGSLVIAIAAVAPLALFRLLAFVDPGTTTGQNFRAALSSYGGIGGVLSGKADPAGSPPQGAGQEAGSGSGVSAGEGSENVSGPESSAEATNSGRMAGALAGLGAGGAAFAGIGGKLMGGLDSAITQGTDALNLAGVGNPQYYYGNATPPRQHSLTSPPTQSDENSAAGGIGDVPGEPSPASPPAPSPSAAPPPPPAPPGGWSGSEDWPDGGMTPPSPTGPPGGSSGGSPGGAGGDGGGASAGAAAGEAETAAVLLV